MRVWFYGFTKKVNSTAQPPGSTEWSPEVNLKGSTSFYAPSLLVGVQTGAGVTRHNYLRIDNVCGVSHAYYFIDNWVSIRNDLYEVQCTMDLLATYKEYILATTAYVEFSQTAGNPQIIDKRVNLSVQPTIVSGSSMAFSPAPSANGMVVFYVTGKNSTGYYATPVSSVTDMLRRMTEWGDNLFPGSYDDSFSGVTSMIGDAVRQLLYSGRIGQNITGACWVPWNITGGEAEIWFGNFQSGFFARKVDMTPHAGGGTLSIPSTGTWLDTSAATDCTLFLPYAGNISIPPELAISGIEVTYGVQLATGNIAYCVTHNNNVIATLSGNAGVPIPLGLSVGNGNAAFNTMVSGVTAAAGILSGAGGLSVAGLSTMIPNAVNAINPLYSTVGGMGNGAAAAIGYNRNITLNFMRHSAITNPDILGAPTNTTLLLGTLTGYVKTIGATVAAPTGKSQLIAINTQLNGGIYIE